MFNKGLNNVEELKRLEKLEKAQEVERIVTGVITLNDFLDPNSLSPSTFNQLT